MVTSPGAARMRPMLRGLSTLRVVLRCSNKLLRREAVMDRYNFSPIVDRPVYDWPEGKRLAVYIALNIEAFEFGRNPGNDFTSQPSAPFHRGYAYRDYGNRVGVWRILRLCEDFQMPLAILANG